MSLAIIYLFHGTRVKLFGSNICVCQSEIITYFTAVLVSIQIFILKELLYVNRSVVGLFHHHDYACQSHQASWYP